MFSTLALLDADPRVRAARAALVAAEADATRASADAAAAMAAAGIYPEMPAPAAYQPLLAALAMAAELRVGPNEAAFRSGAWQAPFARLAAETKRLANLAARIRREVAKVGAN